MNIQYLPSNKRMQSDVAYGHAADAGRYVLVLILLIVSIMILSANEWRSQDLKGNEIKSQRG
jgi:hypothetical protein